MIDFSTWNVQQACEFREAYVASLAARRRWLDAEIDARGGDVAMLSGGEAALGQMWEWATRLIDTGPSTLELHTTQPLDDPQQGSRPPWYDQSISDPWLSDGALWLIELLGVHLADLVVDAVPDARWEVYRVRPSERQDYFQHRTMLFGANQRPMDPAGMIHTSVIGHVINGSPWSEQPTLSSLREFMADE